MSNYIEFENKMAFHPGYYIKELVDESGLTQEDFAKRLGTTPKNLSVLISGVQSLSIEMAEKLSRFTGTSVSYWLNMQQTYDEVLAAQHYREELNKEKEIMKYINYSYFREYFNFPDLARKIEEQIVVLREFLNVASLTVFGNVDFAVSFRSGVPKLSLSNIIKSNIMVQMAVNETLKTEAPKYNKNAFKQAVSFALTQTKNDLDYIDLVKESFRKAGVILVVLPNLKGSGIHGATKKVDGKMMLMVNDRRHYADTFWFSLFHEAGHILSGELGGSMVDDKEYIADSFASNILIPEDKYNLFIQKYKDSISYDAIIEFADSIDQDPGIVYGRLQNDKYIPFAEKRIAGLVRKKIKIS